MKDFIFKSKHFIKIVINISIPLCTDYDFCFLSQFRRDGCSFSAVTAYISTDNFLSLNLVSDWLIFFLWKFDKSSKKEMKRIKIQFFLKKSDKKC